MAGGRSSRYGSDKAFALWGRQTFLENVYAAVSPSVDEVRILGREHHEAAYNQLVPGAVVIPDCLPFKGPVAALAAAMPGDGQVLVASVDAPGLRPRHVRALLHAGRSRVACAAARTGTLPTLFSGPSALVANRIAGAHRLMDIVQGAHLVSLEGPGLNVNAPGDA